uniref:Uncharacterized protein n=1 Tax=Beta vulgaris subsp. maritima TaxID=350892 RepID=F4MLC4_BETVM|nr:hypothetical protein [Beta vulgaris subsp. maritima]
MSSVDRQQRRTSPVQRLYPFFTLPKALFEKLGAGRSEPCAKLHAFSFISRPEPPLMKRVLLVTRLRLRPLMPMKQVFEQSFGLQSFYTKNSNRQGALNRTRLRRY